MKKHYKTIVISDVHLGIRSSRVKELVRFLKYNRCDTLILNGDIIDGWQLKKSGQWKKKHTRFFKLILKYVEKDLTDVIYTRGNHDDFLDAILPLQIGRFQIVRDYIHESCGKRYYVVHGDVFDNITRNMKWVARLGDAGYTFLLWLNRVMNERRIRKGLSYYSFSRVIKLKVKQAVSFISDYEKSLVELSKHKECDGVICGHIHQPDNKMIEDIHYLNSGDWVESLTALTEAHNGEWSVVHYSDWLREYEAVKNYSQPAGSEETIRMNTHLHHIDSHEKYKAILSARRPG